MAIITQLGSGHLGHNSEKGQQVANLLAFSMA
jgi:hypothetical protein